jgi:4-hydroxy-tetrahydrodipicolinate reductase
VIGTTGWDDDRDRVAGWLAARGAAAVAAPNLSLGAALFFRLVDDATRLFGSVRAFDPFVVEWHRRTKRDRPSGTARELVRRIAARHPTTTADDLEVAVVRAGSSPGMHLVGFDAPGETVELRLTARDRSAYAAGAVAAADWLLVEGRTPGLHSFDPVVDALLALPRPVLA